MPVLTANENGVFSSPLALPESMNFTWKTMADYITDTFSKTYPDRKVIEASTEREINYRILFQEAQNLAKKLAAAGIEPKTVIHIVGENSLKWLVVLLACHLNKCVVSASHPVSPWPENRRNIETTCSTVLIITQSCYERLSPEIDSPYLKTVVSIEDSNSGENYTLKSKFYPKTQTKIPQYDLAELSGICELLLSSGTTGPPKAVKLSDYDIISSLVLCTSNGCCTFEENSTTLVVQPLAHIGGQNVSFLTATYRGANIVVTDYKGPINLLECIQKFSIKNLFMVPAVLNFLAKFEQLEKYDISSLNSVYVGGSIISQENVEALEKRTGLRNLIKNFYGATELLGRGFLSNDFYKTKIESIGIPVAGMRFKIVELDNENDVIIEPNKEGHLLVDVKREYSVYFNDIQKSTEAIGADGFYRTGDVVYLDENHNIFVTSRIKDIVKFRGFSVSPAEIEDILRAHSMVADCAVVGEKSEEHGEVPVAFITPMDSREEVKKEKLEEMLIKYVKENIAKHKCIHKVYLIDVIPRSGSGKLLKRELIKLLQ